MLKQSASTTRQRKNGKIALNDCFNLQKEQLFSDFSALSTIVLKGAGARETSVWRPILSPNYPW
jgi:hypothetical protein